ncbi:hypothetical protein [Planotetraspora sp. GP83]
MVIMVTVVTVLTVVIMHRLPPGRTAGTYADRDQAQVPREVV